MGGRRDFGVGLRTAEEVEQWIERCPIRALETELVRAGQVLPAELLRIREQVEAEVERSLSAARAADRPSTGSWPVFEDGEKPC